MNTSADRLVRIAAALLAAYGATVVVYAIASQSSGGWQDTQGFARAVVRFLGMCLIAWGLIQRRRWAWWFAVILPSFWLVAGAGALALYFVPAFNASAALPGTMPGFLAASFIVLAASVIILLRRDVRNHFKGVSIASVKATGE